MTKPEGAWGEIVKRAGLQDARIHDLRRTLASYEALTGANLSTIAATLNHKDLKSTQVYARLNTEAVRRAVESGLGDLLELPLVEARLCNDAEDVRDAGEKPELSGVGDGDIAHAVALGFRDLVTGFAFEAIPMRALGFLFCVRENGHK